MSQLNYSINLVDVNSDQSRYTVELLRQPTLATGGSQQYSNTNSLQTLNILELASFATAIAQSYIAQANQSDTNN